jgi:large subunit ribosomal protein L10
VEKVSKGRVERSAAIEELKGLFRGCEGGVIADFRGLTVERVSQLRARFREHNVAYRVVKNTLTRIAVKGTSLEGLARFLEGPTGVAFGVSDPIAAARVAVEFARENDKFQIKGGFLGDRVLSVAEVTEVSRLGGRSTVAAMLLGALNAPAQQLLGVLNAVPQKFLGVLQAQADKLEKAA